MSNRNIADEWKLEGANQSQSQWVLQEAEQKALGPWQLQDQPQVPIEWQPVDYVRDRRGGANWILPTLGGIALVGVLAVAGWVALNRTGLLESASLPPTEPVATVESPSVAVTTAPTPTEPPSTPTQPPPTPTQPPPTPTLPPPVPTPLPIVDLASALVTADNGVNARSEPSLEGAVIRIVNKDEKFLIAAEQPEWVQVALPSRELAWITAEYVQKSVERMKLENANQRRAEVGLAPLSASAAISGTAPLSPTALIAVAAPITSAVTLTNTPSVTATAIAPNAPTTTAITLAATIAITNGLNARSSPDLTANNVIRLLANGETHTAIARSPDGKWVQLRLTEDDRLAWVASEYVRLSGDLNTLPAAQPTSAGPVAASNPLSKTNAISATQAVSPSITSVVQGVTASVSYLGGANARSTPDENAAPLQTLPFDSVLPVVGRNADSTWIKVTLEEGQLAWVLATEVEINGEIGTLPVAQ